MGFFLVPVPAGTGTAAQPSPVSWRGHPFPDSRTTGMQHVFITGASSGLGQALARRYAADGARLGLLGRRAQALEALAS
uniref:SDR family NAD(P)-dependent oxidoreductase n=2 Tax=Bordetella pertussis TaxID=520 RepID=UPI0038779863